MKSDTKAIFAAASHATRAVDHLVGMQPPDNAPLADRSDLFCRLSQTFLVRTALKGWTEGAPPHGLGNVLRAGVYEHIAPVRSRVRLSFR